MIAEFVSVGSLAIALTLAIINIIKYVRERQKEAKTAIKQSFMSRAERDSLVVQTAEGALVVLEKVLAVTKASEEDLRRRVRELESREREYQERIRVLEDQVRILRKSITKDIDGS